MGEHLHRHCTLLCVAGWLEMQWKNISYILALGTTLLCLWFTVGPSAPTAPMAQARRAPSRDILFPVRSAVPPARTLEQAFPGRLRGGDSSVPETSSSSKCRTSATSIAGGNRYRSDFRHCHGHAGGGSSSGKSRAK